MGEHGRWSALVDAISADGYLVDQWRIPFATVDRARFIPDTIWRRNPAGGYLPVRKAENLRAWRKPIYRNEVVVTQVDDGVPLGPNGTGHSPTSSSSMPGVMAAMLKALDVEDGHQVLEIGTGTGYNTALLCERLGDERITSVEIDPDVSAHAQAALANEGYAPTLVCADGEQGWPGRAPYDRIISTVGVRNAVPYAWVAQAGPGAVLVIPWATSYLALGLARLVVNSEGVASGHFVNTASFMDLRGRRQDGFIPQPDDEPDAVESVSELHPWYVAGDHPRGAFAVSVKLSDCEKDMLYLNDERTALELLVWDTAHTSWATVNVTPEAHAIGRYAVRQFGPRKLWDEIEAVYEWWAREGRPEYTRFGLSVTPEGTRVWLDDPANEW
jgi:protein-L-isoaspartate O-methyltransferase